MNISSLPFDDISSWVLKNAPIDSPVLQQYIMQMGSFDPEDACVASDRILKEMKRKKMIRFCKDRMWRRA